MRVRWTEPAVNDLIHIADYLERHSSSTTARRICDSVLESIESLNQFPEQGRTGRKLGTRELVLTGLP